MSEGWEQPRVAPKNSSVSCGLRSEDPQFVDELNRQPPLNAAVAGGN